MSDRADAILRDLWSEHRTAVCGGELGVGMPTARGRKRRVIRVSHTSADGSNTEVRTDAPYSPDVLEDLITRTVLLARLTTTEEKTP
jgi:hypothetical protein